MTTTAGLNRIMLRFSVILALVATTYAASWKDIDDLKDPELLALTTRVFKENWKTRGSSKDVKTVKVAKSMTSGGSTTYFIQFLANEDRYERLECSAKFTVKRGGRPEHVAMNCYLRVDPI